MMTYLKSRCFQAFILFLFLGQTPTLTAQEKQNTFSLNGVWQLRQQGSAKVYNAIVPGTVQLDLFRNRAIPDPFFGDNESKLQWISDTGWVYEKYFQLTREFLSSRHVKLVCEGLDTYANVYINDSLVIAADNMFKTWYANNIKLILHEGYNRIRIEFLSITKVNRELYSKLTYKLPGDDRSVCRKAAYQFGWDWGPRYITIGIWKSIYLEHWNFVDLLGIQFIQRKLTDSVANMTASFVLNSSLDDSATFKLLYDTSVFFTGREKLIKGVNPIRIDFDITHPRLWWPNSLGTPNLTNIGYQVWFAGRKVAEGHQKIGLRTVELVQRPDSAGKSFYFKINGKPVFIRGANYIPMDNFPSRVTDSIYEVLIGEADAANINMLRVWGGGIYENDFFYDLCDAKGIMVWQDFMFANAMIPDDEHFFNSVRDEVIQNIVRLRRHPSIVVWCGNNEIEEGWKNWGWAKEYGYTSQDSIKIYLSYRRIFHGLIPGTLNRHDTLRPYIPSSPFFGWGNERSLREGDLHYWGVWWGKEPFDAYNQKVGRFVSEYGFQGFPDRSTIGKFTSPQDRQLGSAVMKAHQKNPAGFEIIDEYMRRYYKVPSDFDQYNYVSQLLQADAVNIAIQAHRRAKPYCMGTLFWQLNDSWPVVSWSTRDYYGKRKAAYYTVYNNYHDFFVSSVMAGDTLKVYGTLDGYDYPRAMLRVVVADFDGAVVWQQETVPTFPIERTGLVVDTNLAAFLLKSDRSSLFIYSEIRNIMGVQATNVTYLVPPKDLKLQKAPIDVTISETSTGYMIDLYTAKLAKGVFLSSPFEGMFSDNYFDLLPFEQKRIVFTTRIHPDDFRETLKVTSLVDTYDQLEE